MALPNPGAEAIRRGENLITKAEEHEANKNPGLNLEQINEIFLQHEDAMRNIPVLRRGDIVKLNDLGRLIDFDTDRLDQVQPEQLLMVLMTGKEALNLTGDPFRDCIMNYINKEGKLKVLALGSRFLEKVRSFNQKKEGK
jgi:hypothetical protein